jgi:YidC/Oxa1 family membrane protein insertase
VADIYFSHKGAGIKKIVLKKYFNKPGEQGGPFVMLDLTKSADSSLALNLPKYDQQFSLRKFSADKESLSLKEGEKGSLSFTVVNGGDLVTTRTYEFTGGSYDFKLRNKVVNNGKHILDLTPELSIADVHGRFQENRYGFYGINALVNGSLEELEVSDLEDAEVQTGKIKWMTLCIPYFMGAVIPSANGADAKRSWRGGKKNGDFYGVMVEPTVQLKPNQTTIQEYQAYFGPRDLRIIEPLGHELDRSIDFGWFDIIAKPMLSFVNYLYDVFGNYGIAIIIITILTKLLFWPVTRKSYTSMKRMQSLQPQISKIREKYKDDKQRIQQETMALFKSNKVNPMGGCLPMVVQIPVFIAFYQCLGGSIELRHAPFMLWINDLSAPDRLGVGFDIPYVGGLPVLTLLMGASMFFQQKMTPTTGDPTQAKMMQLLPLVFTVIFVNMPSGLVLYWFINNILSMAQQYFINKSKA